MPGEAIQTVPDAPPTRGIVAEIGPQAPWRRGDLQGVGPKEPEIGAQMGVIEEAIQHERPLLVDSERFLQVEILVHWLKDLTRRLLRNLPCIQRRGGECKSRCGGFEGPVMWHQ